MKPIEGSESSQNRQMRDILRNIRDITRPESLFDDKSARICIHQNVTSFLEDHDAPRIIKKPIIAYIFDIEDERMYPIVDTGSIERHAIELPHIRNYAKDCHVIPAQQGDMLVYGDGDSRILRGQP